VKDLIVLVADKNAKFGIENLLSRIESLGIRKISYETYVHPRHDPGIIHEAAEFLRQFSRDCSYALVLLDHEGSGQENIPCDEVASKLKRDIELCGWQDRVEVIVFNPELENWAWAESRHVAEAFGWNNYPDIKNWLKEHGVWEENALKPKKPKEALELSLKKSGIPRSSSIYQEIAQRVTLSNCQDQSFIKFKMILRGWFPPNQPQLEE